MLETYFLIFLGIQFLHSLEEILTRFHERFPLMRVNRKVFISFEVVFLLFWIFVYLSPGFPLRDALMNVFILLMFANGLWHIVWFWFFERGRKYVPGLVTGFTFVGTFIYLYFSELAF